MNEQRSTLIRESVEEKKDVVIDGKIDDENRDVFEMCIRSIFRMTDTEEA